MLFTKTIMIETIMIKTRLFYSVKQWNMRWVPIGGTGFVDRIRDIIQEDEEKWKKIKRKFYIVKNGVNLAKCTKEGERAAVRLFCRYFYLSESLKLEKGAYNFLIEFILINEEMGSEFGKIEKLLLEIFS